MIIEITPEQIIAKHYSSAMDSVRLIEKLKAKPVLTAEERDAMERNQEHLIGMIERGFWTTENLAPLKSAATYG